MIEWGIDETQSTVLKKHTAMQVGELLVCMFFKAINSHLLSLWRGAWTRRGHAARHDGRGRGNGSASYPRMYSVVVLNSPIRSSGQVPRLARAHNAARAAAVPTTIFNSCARAAISSVKEVIVDSVFDRCCDSVDVTGEESWYLMFPGNAFCHGRPFRHLRLP